jgi:hypothetical protein
MWTQPERKWTFQGETMPMLFCLMCSKEKDRKYFKRHATLAQTRSWLRNPLASKRMTYIGKECNECHKQTRRKTKDLTPEELRKKLVNAEVNSFLVEARVAQRRAQGSKKKSVVARRTLRARWKAKKSNNNQER